MKVYVCVTLYHVYVSLLMMFSEGGDRKHTIIFLNANNEKVYQQYKYIGHQLSRRGVICDVRFRTLKKEILQIERKKNKKQLGIVLNEMKNNMESSFILFNFAWNNSYVYPSAGLLYRKCKEAIFIEESALIAKLDQEKQWKKFAHRLLGDSVDFYKDTKVKKILVQQPELFPEKWQGKIRKLIFSEYIDKLSDKDIDDIFDIMSEDGKMLAERLKTDNFGIVYTCPFSEQGVISEQEKINQVIKICNYYKKYGKIVLKLHPRDESTYPVGDDVIIVPKSFPSELLSLTGYRFIFAVSVCSSAVNTTNAKYKVNMNEGFYNNPVFVLRNINGVEEENE